MFAATKHRTTKHSQHSEDGTLYCFFSHCVQKLMSLKHCCIIKASFPGKNFEKHKMTHRTEFYKYYKRAASQVLCLTCLHQSRDYSLLHCRSSEFLLNSHLTFIKKKKITIFSTLHVQSCQGTSKKVCSWSEREPF